MGCGRRQGGVRLGFTLNDGKYQIMAFGRNITDEENLTGAIDFNNLTGFVNEPRTIGLQLTARYD